MPDASQFVDRVNRQYFTGSLSAGFRHELARLPVERDDVRAFIERMCRFMVEAEMRGQDLSVLQGEIVGSLLARILPGAWQGRVPPITVKGRHRKVDRFLADNRYLGRRDAASMLDLGCGFPPETTVDTADALPGWTIRGADPSMPACMVVDADGAYATFDAGGGLLYCQPSAPTLENWNRLLADIDVTARRFRAIRDRFGDVPAGRHERPAAPRSSSIPAGRTSGPA